MGHTYDRGLTWTVHDNRTDIAAANIEEHIE